jgi:hypothetical protein
MRSNEASSPRCPVTLMPKRKGHALHASGEVRHALEALFVCLHLLEQQRLAGIAERAARAFGLLEHHNLVAIRDQRGADSRQDPRRPAMRSPRGGARPEQGLAPGRAVDHAADARSPRISLMQVLQARQRRIGSPRLSFSTHCGSATACGRAR